VRFSLIIPCYNEAAGLPLLLERCLVFSNTPGIEVILVDNGSTDDTPEVFRDLLPHFPGCRSVRVEENRGYGFGILEGLKASKGGILGWTHGDMQTDPKDTLAGLELFEKHGMDIFVKGHRYGRPFVDVLFTAGMSLFETLLLFRPMRDINAQPNMFSRNFFESWISPPDDFSLDLYCYYQAQMQGLKVHRFPVNFGARLYGTSHWNVDWSAKWRFIRRTISFSLQLKKKISK